MSMLDHCSTVNRSAIGRIFGPYHGTVDANRLRFFAKATGETRSEYLEEAAAMVAGWRNIPAPPTYPFCLQMIDTPDPLGWAVEIGVDMRRVLHGEQSFTYHQPICAGDLITFTIKIVDVYDKKGGDLTFVGCETSAHDQNGLLVAEAIQTLVVRNQ